MFKPNLITFTGADDQTDIAAMRSLRVRFPVEFGILFSKSREGTPRYPTAGWIDAVRGSGLNLAAHVCGEWATQIVQTGRSDIDDRLGGFARVQINTGLSFDAGLIRVWADETGRRLGQDIEVIMQCRDIFPEDERVSWLYDPSGGRGSRPDSWPAPPQNAAVRYGYAGGIGPQNVTEILAAIPHGAGGWIDMESRVRDADDRFSLELCEDVCVSVFGDGA